MEYGFRGLARAIGAFAVASSISGCSIFLPGHSNSNARENERVDIRMIETCGQLEETVKAGFFDGRLPTVNGEPLDAYKEVFGQECKQEEPGLEAVPRVAIASVVVGLGIDHVRDQLKKEATLYEAQWQQRIARDDFWNGDRLRYTGFLVTRTVSDGGNTDSGTVTPAAPADPKANALSKAASQASSATVFALRSSADGQFFLIAPLAHRVEQSKAKVLSDEWETFVPPWVLLTLPGKFARIAGHSIDSDIAVEITAFWLQKQDQKEERKTEAIAAFSVPIRGYDISTNPVLYPGAGLPRDPVGWLAAVPRSTAATSGTAGNFTLKVLVTEKDTSNAQKMLVEAADTLEEKKPVIQNFIVEKLAN
ncbi:conserved hypothetical protein [uncultured Defluviicoccus sp.]|uniref:Lipoprotein n=1 Tax=metagenome TaxID=256318 RepID=A0A380T922_9ZZZZ|nr:conserved hypothetical protein [uncultured Defluviicoccus sp.]